jgi:hypothetical protein
VGLTRYYTFYEAEKLINLRDIYLKRRFVLTDISFFIKKVIAIILTIIALISPNLFKLITGAPANGKNIIFYTETYPEVFTELLFTNDIFEDSTTTIAKKLVTAVIVQFMTGEMSNGEASDIVDLVPIGDIERVPGAVHTSNTLSKLLAGALKDSKLIPESIRGFLITWSEGINDLHVFFRHTEYDGILEFMGSYINDKGELKIIVTGAYYDTESHIVYGKDNNGIFGIGYDCDIDGMVITSPPGAWMKQFGYNIGYDILGNLLFMECDTVRVKFDYDGTKWMVQFWKGNYTSYANGAEIGLYYLKKGEWLNYTCVDGDDMVALEMELYGKDKLILSAQTEKHWWICGFQPGPTFKASDMTVSAGITFNSEGMAEAFAKKASKYMSVVSDGAAVSLEWK